MTTGSVVPAAWVDVSPAEWPFLAALWQAPADPVRHAAYADWLEGAGRRLEADLHRFGWVVFAADRGAVAALAVAVAGAEWVVEMVANDVARVRALKSPLVSDQPTVLALYAAKPPEAVRGGGWLLPVARASTMYQPRRRVAVDGRHWPVVRADGWGPVELAARAAPEGSS